MPFRLLPPLLGLICLVEGANIRLGADSQWDSEELLWVNRGSVEANHFSAPFGSVSVSGRYTHHGILENAFGLTPFNDKFYGLRSHYILDLGTYRLKTGVGWNDLDKRDDFYTHAGLTAHWPISIGTGSSIRSSLSYTGEVNRANPLLSILSMQSRATGLEVVFQTGPWVVETAVSQTSFSAADSQALNEILGTTRSFNHIPENRIWRGHIYFYRPVWDFLYVGAYANFADSRHDFYQATLTPTANTGRYMYFPYETPVESFALGGVLSVSVNLDDFFIPLGTLNSRLTIPFYSRRQQFWEVISPPFYSGSGYYAFEGSEPMLSGVAWKKELISHVTLAIDYSFYLKPYYAYGIFRQESYRLHQVELSTTYSF